ncbi:hypothetical protein Mapa_005311 [Marchantia paleacea]|nr:hypothetical protein Mapa_005311 [Marchantia paleacea]
MEGYHSLLTRIDPSMFHPERPGMHEPTHTVWCGDYSILIRRDLRREISIPVTHDGLALRLVQFPRASGPFTVNVAKAHDIEVHRFGNVRFGGSGIHRQWVCDGDQSFELNENRVVQLSVIKKLEDPGDDSQSQQYEGHTGPEPRMRDLRFGTISLGIV